jgi:hypothetical protein
MEKKKTADKTPAEENVTLSSGGKSVTVSEETFKDVCAGFRGRPRLGGSQADTPNILAPPMPPIETGTETIGPACLELCQMAQGLIDEVREHRHLQDARIMLLVVEKPSMAKALAAGQRKSIGKAGKARSLDRLLSSVRINDEGDAPTPYRAHYEHADFIVRLSGDWLDAIGWSMGLDESKAGEKVRALIDHELCHCGAKIAGEFVKPDKLAAMVEGLGDDHIETCPDCKRNGAVLVRYHWRGEAGGYAWIIRKHDVEEFHGVIERHGAWASQLKKMVDVLVEREDLPLLREAAGKTAETLLSGQKLADQLSGLRQAN